MNKFFIIALCIIITLPLYWIWSENIGPIDIAPLDLESERIEIMHQGYKSRYEHKGIPIEFSEDHRKYKEEKDREAIVQALKLIKENSPEDYQIVKRYVEKINIIPLLMYEHAAGEYIHGTKDIDIMMPIAHSGCFNCDHGIEDYERIAGTIVHEACHSMRYHTGEESALKYSENISYTVVEEKFCTKMQNGFLEKVGSNYIRERITVSLKGFDSVIIELNQS